MHRGGTHLQSPKSTFIGPRTTAGQAGARKQTQRRSSGASGRIKFLAIKLREFGWDVFYTVDGWNPGITSWGNGSLSHYLRRVLYFQVVQDFWTISSTNIYLGFVFRLGFKSFKQNVFQWIWVVPTTRLRVFLLIPDSKPLSEKQQSIAIMFYRIKKEIRVLGDFILEITFSNHHNVIKVLVGIPELKHMSSWWWLASGMKARPNQCIPTKLVVD